MIAPRTRRVFLRELTKLGGSLAGLMLLGGCGSSPATAPPRIYRVGLMLGTDRTGTYKPLFWERLAQLGYVDGQNLARELRLTEGVRLYSEIAVELVGLPVDVIAASLDPAIRACVDATTSIPIVMMGSTLDPVGEGWIESFARPGRNVTGLAGVPPGVELKRLQLLVEAAPGITRVAVLTGAPLVPEEPWRAAAATLGVDLIILEGLNAQNYGPGIERAVAEGADALLIRAGFGAAPATEIIVTLAARHRLPAVYFQRGFVPAGGLMAYEARQSDIDRRTAEYVDRLLRGARPADLPVELPSHYEMVVNIRTARALGLTLSPTFMTQVDEVIE